MILRNSAEGGTDETVVTVGNSGGLSEDPFDAITANAFVFDTAGPMHGALNYRHTPTASTVKEARFNLTAANIIHFSLYIKRTATPTVAHPILQIRNSVDGVVFDLLMQTTSSGRLVLRNSVAAAIYNNALSNLTVDVWHRVEVRINRSAGTVDYALYAGDSTTPIVAPPQFTAVNLAANDITQFRFGRPSAPTTDVTVEHWDSIQIWTDADVPATMSNPWTEPGSASPKLYVWSGTAWVQQTEGELVYNGTTFV